PFSLSPPLSTLSLHDALPICRRDGAGLPFAARVLRPARGRLRRPLRRDHGAPAPGGDGRPAALAPGRAALLLRRRGAGVRPRGGDRKSTRLNSSHEWISYAVF